NLIMGHPKVAEAAIIGIPHPKWQERPLACVTVASGQTVDAGEIREFLKDKVKASWWIPDSFVFLPEIPKTSVGKFNKRELRRMYAAGELTLA
ncbi:MAG TPA: fatty-acid--CoA ligase, partial [Deltaproteobacteria bacterium]|nr:fatty-acid--CoA ligase [Deltaproteobacteria bacterium]